MNETSIRHIALKREKLDRRIEDEKDTTSLPLISMSSEEYEKHNDDDREQTFKVAPSFNAGALSYFGHKNDDDANMPWSSHGVGPGEALLEGGVAI